MKNSKIKYFISIIVALPSVIIGGIAMVTHDIPKMYFALNIACLIVGWLISIYVISKNFKEIKNKICPIIIIAIILLLYAMTFVDSGVDNVHRWLSLGPISLYVSSIFAPIFIIEIWNLFEKNKYLLIVVIAFLAATILFLQPDASQLTSFAVPLIVMLLSKAGKKIPTYIIIAILIFFAITSWIFLDSLPAVIYVEDILGLAMGMGILWSVLGILSLILIPIPFFILAKKKEQLLSVCIGLYYVIFIVSTFFGNFPVPLMGYGVSPIIGYLIAITWLIKNGETGVKAH